MFEPNFFTFPDGGGFSQEVTTKINQDAGITLPPLGDTTELNHSAALSSWTSQEELDIDSSNEEDEPRINPEGTTEGDPTSNSGQSTK